MTNATALIALRAFGRRNFEDRLLRADAKRHPIHPNHLFSFGNIRTRA